LYDAQSGGQLLWSEKQSVQCDEQGHYTVLLGSTQQEGLPLEVFTSRQARWLGVTLESEGKEHARVQLASTPYALKAADADTLGGKPPSAYVLAPSTSSSGDTHGSTAPPTLPSSTPSTVKTQGILPDLTGSGTKNFIPLWTSSTNLGNSVIFQSSSQNIGVG